MAQRKRPDPFPRGALIGAGALIAFTITAAGLARLAGDEPPTIAAADIAQSRDLRFADEPDGGVAVLLANDGSRLATLAPGSNGFVRSMLRGMARERRMNGIGSEPPFTLTLTKGGRLILQDRTIGRFVNLGAFGHTNLEAFAQLMKPEVSGS